MIGVVAAGMPVAWLIARAAGLVAFAFLTVSVTLGLMMSTRLLKPKLQKDLLGWHQTLIWTGLSMLVLHGGAILFDPVMRFGPAAVIVPGTAPWRPITVAAGIVAGYLMLALALSFRVRRRISQRRWRLLHYASFAAFASPSAMRSTPGTDLKGTTGLVFGAIALAPILWLTFARILPRPATAPPADPRQRTAERRRPRASHRKGRSRHDRRPARAGSFRAMGTECEVAVTATRAAGTRVRRALAAGRREVEACERALSRFDERSDLSRLNRAGGEWVMVDHRLIEVLRVALRTREETGGRFDPTILPALVAAGYDRSFEQLVERPLPGPGLAAAGGHRDRPRRLARPRRERRRRRPRRHRQGLRRHAGPVGDARGLARCSGRTRRSRRRHRRLGRDPRRRPLAPRRSPTRAPPGPSIGDDRDRRGAVATSGRDGRRFGPGRRLHHLIDPATGEAGRRWAACRHGRRPGCS